MREVDGADGLILGAMMRAGAGALKKGHVYQIEEVLGELTIRDLGPSWLGKKDWGVDASRLLDEYGRALFVTREERSVLLVNGRGDVLG